jgi:hypothetical protein
MRRRGASSGRDDRGAPWGAIVGSRLMSHQAWRKPPARGTIPERVGGATVSRGSGRDPNGPRPSLGLGRVAIFATR